MEVGNQSVACAKLETGINEYIGPAGPRSPILTKSRRLEDAFLALIAEPGGPESGGPESGGPEPAALKEGS